MKKKPNKAQLLAEAKTLEEMGGDWTLAHAAAFCNWSVAYMARSSCRKHRRKMEGGVKGKRSVYLVPSEVRAWKDAQNADADRAGVAA